MEPLVALSIQQPWLDMIVRQVKTMEIRSWKVRRRGLIALHAPRKIDYGAAHFYGYREPWRLERGKIIAVADISDVIDLDVENWREFVPRHRQPLPSAQGSYGVMLENVRLLTRGIPYRGRQMLFPISEDVAARVRELAGVTTQKAENINEHEDQPGLFD